MNTDWSPIKDILLVEDDPRDVELTLAALEDHLAKKVAVVDNGAAALDYLYYRGAFRMRPGGNPMVVLLDNKMPKVSGLEVLKIIKGDGHLKMIPVVALTSSRRTQDLIEFYEHGVNAYVVKPLDFSEFSAASASSASRGSSSTNRMSLLFVPSVSIQTSVLFWD